VIDSLNKVTIPDVNFKGGYLRDNTLKVTEPTSGVTITPGAANDVTLGIANLAAKFHCGHGHYKKSFLSTSFSVDADISKMTVSVDLGLTTQTLANGKVVPAVTVVGTNVNLPKDGISLHIHGDVIAKLADLLKGLFLGTIRDEITSQLKKAIDSELPKSVNAMLSKSQGVSEVFDGLDLDWSMPTTPAINAQELEFGLKGLFFPKDKGEVEPADQPPVMPYHDASIPSEFQVYISNYLLDSLATSYLTEKGFSFWTKSKDVPASFPIQLTTTGLNGFFPGLEAFYGPNLPVDVQYSLESLKGFTSAEQDQTLSFHSDMAVKFWVEQANQTTSMAVNFTMEDFFFNFTALIDVMEMRFNVTECTLAGITVNSTTFGKVDLALVAKLFNEAIELGIPFFNIYIQKQSIKIPSELFGLFELSDLTVIYHNDFIEAGLTPTFVAPKAREVVPAMPVYDYSQYRYTINVAEDGEVTVENPFDLKSILQE
jgi:hypothetical protein